MKKCTRIFKRTMDTMTLSVLLMVTTFSYSQVLEVRGNDTVITDGTTATSTTNFTSFGTVPNGNKFARSFVLKNTGTSTLNFTGSKVVLSNTTDFSITTNVIVSSNDLTANTYFIIEISYNPTVNSGSHTSTVTITSNSTPAASATYTFNISGTATTAATPDFTMTKLTPNNTFNAPYTILYGSDDFLWLTERLGKKINRVNTTTGVVDLLIDLSTSVYATGGQDGLLSMIFDRDFATNKYVYVAYTYSTNGTDAGRRTRIVRFTYSITGSDGSLASPQTIIENLAGSNDHNSGKLKIGPDNKLYYTIGDNGANQFGNKCNPIQSQTLPTQVDINAGNYFTSYQGKILRMNLDGTIPADNPILKGVRSHIYSYGHRNAQGLVFGKNGKLYSSEHGPKSDDELNIITSGGNYGWPFIAGYKDGKNYAYCNWSSAGTNCAGLPFSDYVCGTGATSTTEMSWTENSIVPIATFFTIDDGYNFTGGYLSWPTIAPSSTAIYEGFGSQIPGWDNSLLTTTLKKGELYRQKLSPNGSTVVGVAESILYTQNRYRDIAIAPDGKTLYIITDSSGATSGPSGSANLTVQDPGVILKFVYQPAVVACTVPVPDVTTLPTITSDCAVTLTAPTATNSCAGTGGISGLTDTVFPITAPGNTTVVWTYKYSNGLTLTQNQTVTINSSTWNGTVWNNGVPTSSIAAVIAGPYSVSANLTACSLTVNNNAIVIIPSGFNVTLNGALTVSSGSFTLENNANLIQTSNFANSGNINVKRNSSALFRLDYTIWSSPVTGSQTLGSFSPLTATNRFYEYSTSTNLYNAISNTTPFSLAKGFLIRMPNNWVDYVLSPPSTPLPWTGTFTGIPNNGNISQTMSTAGTGFNAVGNPYPSTVNIDNFINGNTGNIDGTLYFWRRRNNITPPPTAYSTCTTAGCTVLNSHTYPNVDFISVGQGFIVKATSTTVNFNNSMRVANNTNQFFKTKAIEKNRIWLNLLSDGAQVNQMMLAYMTGATMDIDPGIDGAYINDSQTALNSLIGEEEFAVQGRALPFDGTDIVPLSFKVVNPGNYTIAIDRVDGLFAVNQEIILKDNETGIETDLKTEGYTFTAVAGVTKTRFLIKYQKTLGTNTPLFDENSIIVFKNEDVISIKSNGTAIENVKLFDIKGRLLFEKTKVNANETSIESSKFANQVLIVQITSDDNKVVNKKIVN